MHDIGLDFPDSAEDDDTTVELKMLDLEEVPSSTGPDLPFIPSDQPPPTSNDASGAESTMKPEMEPLMLERSSDQDISFENLELQDIDLRPRCTRIDPLRTHDNHSEWSVGVTSGFRGTGGDTLAHRPAVRGAPGGRRAD